MAENGLIVVECGKLLGGTTHRTSDDPWAGTVTGTISPDAITMEVRASATIEGEACDTGALTLTLDQRAR